MKKHNLLHADTDLPDHLVRGFVETYKDVFAGKPYEEHYEDHVPEGILKEHLHSGVVILAVSDDKVVGFGCAQPLTHASEEVREYVLANNGKDSFPGRTSDTWYMSELGVLEGYRNQGLGTALVRERLVRLVGMGITYYSMRTAQAGSNSLALYKRFGAIELPGAQDVSATAQVAVNKSQSTSRVYLYGSCVDMLGRMS